jgi:hypothetical protein
MQKWLAALQESSLNITDAELIDAGLQFMFLFQAVDRHQGNSSSKVFGHPSMVSDFARNSSSTLRELKTLDRKDVEEWLVQWDLTGPKEKADRRQSKL